MKVKVLYYTVAVETIDIDDKFSKLNPHDVDMLADLCSIGWDTVVNKQGNKLLAIETLDGETLLEL